MTKKKNTKVTKSEAILVRMTPSQKTTLEAAASKEGMGLSPWLLRLGIVASNHSREGR